MSTIINNLHFDSSYYDSSYYASNWTFISNSNNNLPVNVTFDISLNGIDWSVSNYSSVSSNPLWVVYYPTPVLLSFWPDHGTWVGGTLITLNVLGIPQFLYGSSLVDKFICRFGKVSSIIVPATIV